tara:strand:+ start:104 stop:2023 length:1920 start_codon:yes stop_codon:yes gene_type:complete
MANGLNYESPLNRLLSVTLPQFLNRELDRKQRKEEAEANQEFRQQQFDSLNEYRDEQNEFRDKQFEANQAFRDEQLQREDERDLFSDITRSTTLDKKTNMLKVLGEMDLSPSGKKRYDIMLSNHTADSNNPIRSVAGFRDVTGIQEAWETSGLANKVNLTNLDKRNFFKDFMTERNIFTQQKSLEVAGFMNGAELSRKNLTSINERISTERAGLLVADENMSEKDIRDKLTTLYSAQKKEQQRLDKFSNEAFSALTEAGVMPDIIPADDQTPGDEGLIVTPKTNFFDFTGGSILPTYQQVKDDATYIGSFTLPDGGQATIDASRDITLNEPADFDPNKNFEQEEQAQATTDEPKLLDYTGTLDYIPETQSPPVSSVPQGDPVDAVSRLAGVEMAEDYGIKDLPGKIGDIIRGAPGVQRQLGTEAGGLLSMGGATKDQIKAVRNAEVNLQRINDDLVKLPGRAGLTKDYKFGYPDFNIKFESEDEYLALNDSKNKEFQSYLINISQALQQTNLTDRVKTRLNKTLEKFTSTVDKAVAKSERGTGSPYDKLTSVYNKETVALVNAIKTGKIPSEESVEVVEESGLESELKQAFENLNPEEKQAYNNDFEVYLTSYTNRIRNMVTYGKMDQAEGASILQELQ